MRQRTRQRRAVRRFDQHAVAVVVDRIDDSADTRGHYRQAARHRLEHRHAKPLHKRGHRDSIERPQDRARILDLPEHPHCTLEAETADIVGERAAERAVAGDDCHRARRQVRGGALRRRGVAAAHPRDRLEQEAMALAGLEGADCADGAIGALEPQRRAGRCALGRLRRPEVRAVHTARNHDDALARHSGARERIGDADALARAGVPRERIVVIPSGVDCAHFRPPQAAERAAARAALGLEGADRAIGAIGALEPRKGHRFLLEAIARMRRGDTAAAQSAAAHLAPRPVAIIAGDGSLRRALADDIRRLGLEGAVRMLGQVEDARPILWALDAVAMPSLMEGLGVAMLEAMACGLAVVASRVGGIVDAIDDDRDGMLVEPANGAALARALAHLCADSRARLALGAAARAIALERFSIETMALRTVELYRACLQTDASARALGAQGI